MDFQRIRKILICNNFIRFFALLFDHILSGILTGEEK